MARWRSIAFLGILIVSTLELNAKNNKTEHKIYVQVPEVALLSLQHNNHQVFSLKSRSPEHAGSSIDFTGNNQGIWINYSSTTARYKSRKITASLEGELPKGLEVRITPHGYEGDGQGDFGRAEASSILSDKPVTVLSGIGTCYTGRGTGSGHFISYELVLSDSEKFYGHLNQTQSSVQVVYTLTDNN